MEYKCEKCGATMRVEKTHGSIAYVCPNCGFGIATTYLEPIAEDNTLYEIYLDGNETNKETLSVISRLTGKNFIELKSEIEEGRYIYKDIAIKIKNFKDTLDSSNIKYRISPKYPY